MKSRKISPAFMIMGAAAVLVAGCGKESEPPAPTVAAPPPVAAVQPSEPATAPAPEAAQLDDTALAMRVRTALQADPEVQALNIDVAASQGVVQLSGFVDSRAQTEKAGAIASAVEGVRSVDNRLDMKAGSTVSAAPAAGQPPVAGTDDASITNQIKAGLLGDPYLNNFDVAVVTRNGEVQLSGFVPSQEQADDVIALAHKTEGVKNVISTLTVGGAEGRPQQ